jgi:cytochrome P450
VSETPTSFQGRNAASAKFAGPPAALSQRPQSPAHGDGYEAPRRRPFADFVAQLAVSFARLYAAAFREIWPLYVLWPAPWLFPGLRLLVRYDHAVEALSRPDVFEVPFGSEMARLNDGVVPGTPFLLGIDNPQEHDKQARCLMAQLDLDDVAAVAKMAFEAAQQRLPSQASDSFEAIHELITAVPIDLCNRYLGLSVKRGEERDFAAAGIDLSGHLFGAPSGPAGIAPSKDRQEDKAGDYVRRFVDQAIANAKATASPAVDGAPETLAFKLRGASNARARAVLMGMIVGFVPTNTLAGGHILDVLLSNHDAMDAAVKAATAGDDDRLWRCLIEALRLHPINLGPFRICKRGYRFEGAAIPEGQRVWVMTGSAMHDSRRIAKAGRFNPERTASSYLHFGFGMHWCIGAMLAQAQLTQTFKALLLRGAPARKSKLGCRATFPDELKIAIKG